MYKYNVSKYNPTFRDDDWRYMKEDWTAISDIGKIFNEKMLTAEDYIAIENSYIEAIQLIYRFLDLKFLKVSDVKKGFEEKQFLNIIRGHKVEYTAETLDLYNNAEYIDKLEYKDINLFFRLLLRESIGAKIYYPRRLKIFICYDYLMGINSSRSLDKIIPKIEELGLFVEEFFTDAK